MIATTLFGFEELLVEELKALGANDIEPLNRAVMFTGDKKLMYKCNLHLRTALKVLKPFTKFLARDGMDLYKKIGRTNWDELVSVDGTFAIDATIKSEHFTHSQFTALRAKDSIVDQFREKYERRPSIDLDNPDLRINIHINDRTCSVSLDSSGTTLNKRGYRKEQAMAPINEVLAAGIIMQSGWDKKSDFLDPMCGSGTIPIEAALIASNRAPGRLRNFGFQNWKDFDAELWEQVKKEAEDAIVEPECKIFGSDLENRSVAISHVNAAIAEVDDYVDYKQMDFLKTRQQFKDGFIVINPPYGERLKDSDEIIPFYQEIGTQLKHNHEGCTAWIISSNMRALKFVGLRPSRKIKIFNGPLECRLQKYELFRGKKSERFEKKD